MRPSHLYVALPLAALLPAGAAAAGLQHPNIIFIMADDLGYGDLACYGQHLISTPCIDRMAQEGMRFTQAYAGAPVSAPSRASLMTGQHTGHTRVRGNKEYWPEAPLVRYGNNTDYARVGQQPYDPQQPILPEIMKRAGYATALFGKWAGGYEGSVSTPDKRGIDEFYGYICQFQAHLYYPNFLNAYSRQQGDTAVTRQVLEQNIAFPMSGDDYRRRSQYSADLIHRHALEWLDRQDGRQPFLALLTYTLPHAELAQPDDSLLRAYKQRFFTDKTWGGQPASRYNAVEHTHAQFAAMITRLDTYVGQIMQKLQEKGLADNTIVVFTSDNGPHEEGGADPEFFGRDGMLRGLKRQCYEGGIRVPFIVWWPGHVGAATVNDTPMAFYDMVPTLCDLAGISTDASTGSLDGLSMARTILGQPGQPQHEFLYWEFSETDQMAVRMGNWKLLVDHGQPRLYDLGSDVHEDHDVAAEHPDVVSRLTAIARREHVASADYPVTLPR